MTNIEEIWKDIPNYEGLYQVSNLGSVKSSKNNLPVKRWINKGYFSSSLYKDGKVKRFRVHQLVAMAFLNHMPCGHKLVVNHKNFVKTDNRADNLEIITQRQNSNKKHINHSSNYTGVSWDKRRNKWESYIRISGKKKHLGYFTDEYQASIAYHDKKTRI